MNYVSLGEEEGFRIEIQGCKIDAYTLGVININIQIILDKVVAQTLDEHGLFSDDISVFFANLYRYYRPFPVRRGLARADVINIGIGSLIQDVLIQIPSVLADANVRGVLQGVAGNIIYGIGTSGINGIRNISENARKWIKREHAGRNDPFGLGENVRSILLVLAENYPDKKIKLKISTKISGEETSVELEIE